MSIAEIERFAADLQSSETLRAAAKQAQTGTPETARLDRAVAFAAQCCRRIDPRQSLGLGTAPLCVEGAP